MQKMLDKQSTARQMLAAKQTAQLDLAGETVLAVVQAAAIAFKDPTRVADVNAMSTRDILLLGLQASAILLPLQEAARLAGQNV
jgi:hypothetical protein